MHISQLYSQEKPAKILIFLVQHLLNGTRLFLKGSVPRLESAHFFASSTLENDLKIITRRNLFLKKNKFYMIPIIFFIWGHNDQETTPKIASWKKMKWLRSSALSTLNNVFQQNKAHELIFQSNHFGIMTIIFRFGDIMTKIWPPTPPSGNLAIFDF